MINCFRQLTLPWLIAVAAMAVCTGLWYHAEMNSQQRGQIEQFSRSLQLGLAPLLKSRDAELVRAQLNHIRYSSTLPLTAIVIYDSQ